MPHWEIIAEEVSPYKKQGIHTALDFKLSGDYRSATRWTLDAVAVPGTRESWVLIPRTHPLYAIGADYASSDEGYEAIEAEIARCRESEAGEAKYQAKRDARIDFPAAAE